MLLLLFLDFTELKTRLNAIELISNVVKHEKYYEYTYVLKNTGKKTFKVGCSIPDLAMQFSFDEGIYHYYLLKSGESVKIIIKNKSPPVLHTGQIRCFNKNRHEAIADHYKEHNIEIIGNSEIYYFQFSGAAIGYIPKRVK